MTGYDAKNQVRIEEVEGGKKTPIKRYWKAKIENDSSFECFFFHHHLPMLLLLEFVSSDFRFYKVFCFFFFTVFNFDFLLFFYLFHY